jgi:dienelactone hydrolase
MDDRAIGDGGAEAEYRGAMKIAGFFLLLAALVPGFGSSARADELSEESTFFPVTIGGSTVRLEGFIVKKSDAQGRLPVAIITNGGTAIASAATASLAVYEPVARDLARRGWLAAVVIRRGFGKSEGAKPTPVPCQAGAFATWASAAADDLEAALQFLQQRPDADPDRAIVMGSASAGVAVAALSARNPRGLAAVVNIAGGLQSESKCPMDSILTDAFKDFGAKSRVPNLWIYARSDKVFPPDLTNRMHEAFLDGGGDVKFVLFHINGDAGNAIFGSARLQWFVQLDGFLRARHLPTWATADVDDILGKLKLTQSNIKEIAHSGLAGRYFPAPGEKALAYSKTAGAALTNPENTLTEVKLPWAWTTYATTLDAARKAALEACEKTAAAPCAIVMENNRWVGETP